jgi:HEAT repeat protein
MRCHDLRSSWIGLLLISVAVPVAAQTTTEEFREAFASGDSKRCMEAANQLTDDAFAPLGAELAPHLLEVVKADGECAQDALRGLQNLGPSIAAGLDAAAAIEVLMPWIDRPSDDGSSSAVSALGSLGPAAAPAVPAIATWLEGHDDSTDQYAALWALAKIGDAAAPAVPAILAAMIPPEDEDAAWGHTTTLNAGIHALGQIPSAVQQSGPVLAKHLIADDYGVDEAMAEIGAPILPYLAPLLDHEDPEVRGRAATVLGGLGPAAAPTAPRLVELLSDEDWNVQYNAGVALEQIGATEGTTAALIELVETTDNEDAQESAINILGYYGPDAEPALPILRKLAKDGGWSIRNAAESAIAAIEQGE